VPTPVRVEVIAGDFKETNNCGLLEPSKDCKVNVTFKPLKTGFQSGNVRIRSPNNTFNIGLTGTGMMSPRLSMRPAALYSKLSPGERLIEFQTGILALFT
jgi:hypothetical protein